MCVYSHTCGCVPCVYMHRDMCSCMYERHMLQVVARCPSSFLRDLTDALSVIAWSLRTQQVTGPEPIPALLPNIVWTWLSLLYLYLSMIKNRSQSNTNAMWHICDLTGPEPNLPLSSRQSPAGLQVHLTSRDEACLTLRKCVCWPS